jgi:hypothetical protein
MKLKRLRPTKYGFEMVATDEQAAYVINALMKALSESSPESKVVCNISEDKPVLVETVNPNHLFGVSWGYSIDGLNYSNPRTKKRCFGSTGLAGVGKYPGDMFNVQVYGTDEYIGKVLRRTHELLSQPVG